MKNVVSLAEVKAERLDVVGVLDDIRTRAPSIEVLLAIEIRTDDDGRHEVLLSQTDMTKVTDPFIMLALCGTLGALLQQLNDGLDI